MKIKFSYWPVSVIAISVILTACCKKDPEKRYSYIDTPDEIKAYFAKYDTLGRKWIYKNKSKTITDTFIVTQLIDSMAGPDIAMGGVPCPPSLWDYHQEKGFKLKTMTFGELTGTSKERTGKSMNIIANYNDRFQDELIGIYFEKGVLVNSGSGNLVDNVKLNDSIYLEQEIYESYSNATRGFGNVRFYLSKSKGILGWADSEKNDTFNLVKYEK